MAKIEMVRNLRGDLACDIVVSYGYVPGVKPEALAEMACRTANAIVDTMKVEAMVEDVDIEDDDDDGADDGPDRQSH